MWDPSGVPHFIKHMSKNTKYYIAAGGALVWWALRGGTGWGIGKGWWGPGGIGRKPDCYLWVDSQGLWLSGEKYSPTKTRKLTGTEAALADCGRTARYHVAASGGALHGDVVKTIAGLQGVGMRVYRVRLSGTKPGGGKVFVSKPAPMLAARVDPTLRTQAEIDQVALLPGAAALAAL